MMLNDLDPDDQMKVLLKRKRDEINWGEPDLSEKKEVSVGELCFLARKRMGWGVREASEKIGISHVTLIKRERSRGEVEALKEFWEAHGWGKTQAV